jgi:PKD domain
MGLLDGRCGGSPDANAFHNLKPAARIFANSRAMGSASAPERLLRLARSVPLATLACLALGSLGARRAQATPTWLPPVTVYGAEAGQQTQNARVSLDPRGDVFAVWERFKPGASIVQAAIRPAGGAWQEPVTLSEPGQAAYNPEVAVDSHGDAVAVWMRYVASSGERVIQSALKPVGGAWSAPTNLSPAGQFAINPKFAVDSHGNAVVVWESHAEEWNVQAASMPTGGGWQAPVTIGRAGARNPSVHVFVDSKGNALAAWDQQSGSNETIDGAIKPAGDVWQAPAQISAEGQVEAQFGLAFDAHGDAVAVWQSHSEGSQTVQAALRPADGAWEPPTTLSEAGQEAYAPWVAVNPSGGAVVTWMRYSPGCKSIIQAAGKPVGGLWRTPVNLSAPGYSAGDAEVAISKGRAVASWERHRPCTEPDTEGVIQSATGTLGGVWRAPVNLSEIGPHVSDARLATDAHGNAVALWQAENGGSGLIQAAGYDAAGPLPEALSIATAGTVGEPLAFSVSPLDVWSQLGPTNWSFGDGTSATGTSVAHTYAAPGTYKVTLTSEDVLGNITRRSKMVAIAP